MSQKDLADKIGVSKQTIFVMKKRELCPIPTFSIQNCRIF
ncbi:hypothetical protein [Carnobacterium maltaromaticum]